MKHYSCCARLTRPGGSRQSDRLALSFLISYYAPFACWLLLLITCKRLRVWWLWEGRWIHLAVWRLYGVKRIFSVGTRGLCQPWDLGVHDYTCGGQWVRHWPRGMPSMDWRPAVQVADRGSEQWRPKDLICRERKILFAWLISRDWKYCSLVYHERKILFVRWFVVDWDRVRWGTRERR
jgi:hypothetical protein